jgi:hypothetical protein
MNSHYYDDYLRVFEHVHLGVAVDTPRGLMDPTIKTRHAQAPSFLNVSSRRLKTAVRVRSTFLRKGEPLRIQSRLLRVEIFYAGINPPQTGILGVCCVTRVVKTDVGVYPAMGLSQTYDHRAVDGAPAAAFMRRFQKSGGIDLCVDRSLSARPAVIWRRTARPRRTLSLPFLNSGRLAESAERGLHTTKALLHSAKLFDFVKDKRRLRVTVKTRCFVYCGDSHKDQVR